MSEEQFASAVPEHSDEVILTTTAIPTTTTTESPMVEATSHFPRGLRVASHVFVVTNKPNAALVLSWLIGIVMFFLICLIIQQIYQTYMIHPFKKEWIPQQTLLHDDTVVAQMREQIPGKRNNRTTYRPSKRSVRAEI